MYSQARIALKLVVQCLTMRLNALLRFYGKFKDPCTSIVNTNIVIILLACALQRMALFVFYSFVYF